MRLSLLAVSVLALLDVIQGVGFRGEKATKSRPQRQLRDDGGGMGATDDGGDGALDSPIDDDFVIAVRSSRAKGGMGGSTSTSKSDKSDKSGKKNKNSKSNDDACYGTIAVANRGDGTISILDANDSEYLDTIILPYDTETMSEPVPADVVTVNGNIYVSDSANDRILAFDAVSYNLVANIPTGDTPTEMSADFRGSVLWVTNSGDNTVIVIDLAFNVPIRSIEAFDPAGDIDFGENVVNDVLLSASGDAGFVSYTGDGGLVVRFDSNGVIQAFNTDIGDSARLGSSFRFNCLYVPSADLNVLDILFNLDLQIDQTLDIDSPFDVVPSLDGQFMYFTSTINDAIYTFDVGNNTLIDTVVTTQIPGPTRLAHTGDRLFVSHSATNEISFFAVSSVNPIPIELGYIDVGIDPFGISYNAPTGVCGY